MKKAIAMKCTQEQFDAVKDKLIGCEIEFMGSFEIYEYFKNIYNGYSVSNILENCKNSNNREVHEIWNEEIFLNACGIETERIFKASEMQCIRYGKWVDFSDSLDSNIYRLKPANLIKKQELESQILELQNQLKNL